MINEGHDDITTGVTTWGLMDSDDIQTKVRHDMVGDTSRSETRRVGSGRAREGCYRGLRWGEEGAAPVTKTGTNGLDRMSDLQWTYEG